jgi:hypothetical protein
MRKPNSAIRRCARCAFAGALALLLAAAAATAQDAVFVDSSGRVGIGTVTPTALLDVHGTAPSAALMRVRNTSATGYSGIEFLNQSGTAVSFIGVNNNNNTTRLNSINNSPLVLLTESVERIHIEPNGNVGIGCNAPSSDLVIASGNGCAVPSSSLNAGNTQFTPASSRTFKENLAPVAVPGILEKIAGVEVYSYDFIDGPKDRMGLMSEDFHQIFGRGSDRYLSGDEVQMALWLAVRELTARNLALTEANQALDRRLAFLEARLQEPTTAD